MNFSPTPIDIAALDLRWSDAESSGAEIDPGFLKILTDTTSLTQQLIKLSDGDFRVELLEERWMRIASLSLRAQFGPVHEDQDFWSRKVILRGHDEPWVMAHSLMPRHALRESSAR